MAPEVSKRRLPRFSLITLVVVVNVAGVLVWANLRNQPPLLYPSRLAVYHQGWPMPHYSKRSQHITDRKPPAFFGGPALPPKTRVILREQWHWKWLIGNMTISLVIIASSAVCAEFLVRKAKRHDG